MVAPSKIIVNRALLRAKTPVFRSRRNCRNDDRRSKPVAEIFSLLLGLFIFWPRSRCNEVGHSTAHCRVECAGLTPMAARNSMPPAGHPVGALRACAVNGFSLNYRGGLAISFKKWSNKGDGFPMIWLIFCNRRGLGWELTPAFHAGFLGGRGAAAGIALLALYANFATACCVRTLSPKWIGSKIILNAEPR